MNRVGKQLKKARLAKGYSQKKVADLLGYTTPQHYSQVELGKINAGPTVIVEMSRVLEIDINKLVNARVSDYKDNFFKKIKGV